MSNKATLSEPNVGSRPPRWFAIWASRAGAALICFLVLLLPDGVAAFTFSSLETGDTRTSLRIRELSSGNDLLYEFYTWAAEGSITITPEDPLGLMVSAEMSVQFASPVVAETTVGLGAPLRLEVLEYQWTAHTPSPVPTNQILDQYVWAVDLVRSSGTLTIDGVTSPWEVAFEDTAFHCSHSSEISADTVVFAPIFGSDEICLTEVYGPVDHPVLDIEFVSVRPRMDFMVFAPEPSGGLPALLVVAALATYRRRAS